MVSSEGCVCVRTYVRALFEPSGSQNDHFWAPGNHFFEQIVTIWCFLELKMESKIIKICILTTNSNDLVLFGGRNCPKWSFWSTRKSLFWTNDNDLVLFGAQNGVKNHQNLHFDNKYMQMVAFWMVESAFKLPIWARAAWAPSALKLPVCSRFEIRHKSLIFSQNISSNDLVKLRGRPSHPKCAYSV